MLSTMAEDAYSRSGCITEKKNARLAAGVSWPAAVRELRPLSHLAHLYWNSSCRSLHLVKGVVSVV